MRGSGVAAAVEVALRNQLALTDQPRSALVSIAEELFTALAHVAETGPAGVLEHVQREFSDAFAKVWREYGEDEPLPAIRILPAPALRARTETLAKSESRRSAR